MTAFLIKPSSLGDPETTRRWARSAQGQALEKELAEKQESCFEALCKAAANSTDPNVTRAWARLDDVMEMRNVLKEAGGLKNE